MSRGPKRNYTNRTVSPKIRASKFPYLPEKIEEILDYYRMNVSELARRTHIKQSGLSKCLNGHNSITEQAVRLLSGSLDDPIPLWWLMAGLEAGSLHDVLAKEPQEEERRQEVRRKEDRLRRTIPPEQQALIRSLQKLHENLQQAMTSIEEELSTLHQTTGGGGIQEDK